MVNFVNYNYNCNNYICLIHIIASYDLIIIYLCFLLSSCYLVLLHMVNMPITSPSDQLVTYHFSYVQLAYHYLTCSTCRLSLFHMFNILPIIASYGQKVTYTCFLWSNVTYLCFLWLNYYLSLLPIVKLLFSIPSYG